MACTTTFRYQGTAMQAGESNSPACISFFFFFFRCFKDGYRPGQSADAGLTSSEMLGDGRCPSSSLAGEPGLKSPLA